MKSEKLKKMLLTAIFAALTAIGAFLRIPAGFTSFTLQFFFTCMAGVLLGPYWGAASQLLYVLLGLIGIPIFTEGGGMMYLFKPTFGFLLGLIPAAFLSGLLTTHLKKLPLFGRIALGCMAGLAALYAIGLPYMYWMLGGAYSLRQTVISGCLIFLPFDALKIICVTLLGTKLLPLINRKTA